MSALSPRQELRILTFHGVGTPERALEPGEAPFWVSTERFVTILDRIVAHPERRKIAITFDDSNRSDVSIAAPNLLSRGLTASFFVLTARTGLPGSLGRDDIRALQAQGMRIGSHGVAHSDWSRLSPDALREELLASRSSLGEICGAAPDAAAIPFGRYNAAVLRALRAAGYRVAYSSDRGRADAAAFLQYRTSVRADTSDAELDAILSGYLPPLRRLRRSLATAVKRLF